MPSVIPLHRLVVILTVAGSILPIHAATNIEQTDLGASKTLIQNQDHSAQWAVTTEDWHRYQEIMSVKGQYLYKDLDPVTVLGLNARTDKERDRYAEILAKQEFSNTRALVLLDQAYNRAFARLYGHVPFIDPLKVNQAKALLNPVSSKQVRGNPGDRYIVFARTDCSACDREVSSLLGQMMMGVSIDIHFDADSRKAITNWASRMKISSDAVQNGKITLNPNSELYARFGNPIPPALYFFDQSANEVSEVK